MVRLSQDLKNGVVTVVLPSWGNDVSVHTVVANHVHHGSKETWI